MQPVPLPELANAHAPLWIILVALGAILTVVCVGVGLFKSESPGKASVVFCTVGVLGFGVFIAGGLLQAMGSPTWQDEHEAQAREIQPQIEESYGLELSTDEIIDLKWPTEDPTQDFQVFGSLVNQKQVDGAQFIERTIYLVWADGTLQLSESEDGKSFSELEPTE